MQDVSKTGTAAAAFPSRFHGEMASGSVTELPTSSVYISPFISVSFYMNDVYLLPANKSPAFSPSQSRLHP
jgi:hypothetical protein